MDVAIGIVISLVLLWVACLVLFWLFRPKGVSAREIVAVIPDVLRLLRALITDGAVPWDVRIVLIGLVAWILSPIDLIPEFIPVLGPLDDVVVAIVAFRFVRRRIGITELDAAGQAPRMASRCCAGSSAPARPRRHALRSIPRRRPTDPTVSRGSRPSRRRSPPPRRGGRPRG